MEFKGKVKYSPQYSGNIQEIFNSQKFLWYGNLKIIEIFSDFNFYNMEFEGKHKYLFHTNGKRLEIFNS